MSSSSQGRHAPVVRSLPGKGASSSGIAYLEVDNNLRGICDEVRHPATRWGGEVVEAAIGVVLYDDGPAGSGGLVR